MTNQCQLAITTFQSQDNCYFFQQTFKIQRYLLYNANNLNTYIELYISETETIQYLYINQMKSEKSSRTQHCWPFLQKLVVIPSNCLFVLLLCHVCSVCKGSPLGELYRCVEEKIRVRVHIRTFKGLRGVCSGFVVAFDKFWNMVSANSLLTAAIC